LAANAIISGEKASIAGGGFQNTLQLDRRPVWRYVIDTGECQLRNGNVAESEIKPGGRQDDAEGNGKGRRIYLFSIRRENVGYLR
jgi:hypothetical protein